MDRFTALVQVRGVRPNLPRQAEPRHPHAPLPQDRDPGVPRARLQQDLQTQVHTTSPQHSNNCKYFWEHFEIIIIFLRMFRIFHFPQLFICLRDPRSPLI